MAKLLSTVAVAAALALPAMAYADKAEHGKSTQEQFPLITQLPEQDASLFTEALNRTREENRALREQMEKLHEALYTIATQDTFDKKAFIARSAELEKLRNKLHANIAEAYASALSKLPAQERKTLVVRVYDKQHHASHGPEHGGIKATAAEPDRDQSDTEQ